MPEAFFQVSRLLRGSQRFDTVICGIDEFSLILGCFAGRKVQAPVFCVVEDPPFTDRYAPPIAWARRQEKGFRRILVEKLLGSCSGIFCFIEKEVLQEFKIGSTPVYQLMNGVSFEALEWAKCREAPPNGPSEYRIGYVGALNQKQGIHDLLEIFAEAWKKVARSQLRLIGLLEKGYAHDYQQKIRSLALDGNVEITGWLPYEQMLEKLEECHIGIYCHQPNEWVRVAQPLKVCEYLALRKPTVSWDYPGTRRLLDGGRHGLLVPPGNKSAFVEALISLSDKGAREKIEDQIRFAVRNRWNSHFWYGQVLEILLQEARRHRYV